MKLPRAGRLAQDLPRLLAAAARELASSWLRARSAPSGRPNRSGRLRAQLLLSALLLGYGGIGYRLYTLQIRDHEHWREVARRQHTRTREVPPERGRLLLRDGERTVPAAVSVERYSLLVYGREDRDAEGFIERLERALADLTPEERATVTERLASGRSFYVRRRRLTRAEADAVNAARLPHVELSPEPLRVYPFGGLATQVLGLTSDGQGSTGLERRFERWLQGVPGRRELRRDVLGRELVAPGDVTQPAQPGYDLALTLDRSLQAAVEDELARMAEEHKPQGAAAVVVDPRTGDILAMASWPSYDPAQLGEDFVAGMANRAICHVYEPGSTIKPLLVGTAWELGLGGPERPISCPRTYHLPGRRKAIEDSHTVGDVLEADVLVQSSNSGAVQITNRMSPEQIRRALGSFGLGHATGIDLSGEETGDARALEHLDPTTLGSIAQGYALTVTPLQMALAYGAIANGGTLFRPRLVAEVRDRAGRVLERFEPQARSRPLSAPLACGPLREALVRVVGSEQGTARRARSKFYAVAGKTGTTKLLVNGQYDPREVVASFSGFAPAEDPQVAFCVVAWGPDTTQRRAWGGTVAAPCAGRIAERALRLLRVPPSPPEVEATK